jgi:hypothetical protein
MDRITHVNLFYINGNTKNIQATDVTEIYINKFSIDVLHHISDSSYYRTEYLYTGMLYYEVFYEKENNPRNT